MSNRKPWMDSTCWFGVLGVFPTPGIPWCASGPAAATIVKAAELYDVYLPDLNFLVGIVILNDA